MLIYLTKLKRFFYRIKVGSTIAAEVFYFLDNIDAERNES